MLQVINYLFVPALSVLIHERSRGVAMKFSARLLAIYLFYTAAIIPCTHVFVALLRNLFGVEIFPETSTKYTLLALISAAALPALLKLLQGHAALKMQARGERHA